MFETRVNEKLSCGGQFKVPSLDNNDVKEISFKSGEYMPMNHRNSESVDGYCYKNGDLLLFQITVAQRHPVKANGLHLIIEQFKNEKFKNVFLIFVVPESDISDIPRLGPERLAALKKINVNTIEEALAWAKLEEKVFSDSLLVSIKSIIQNYAESEIKPTKFKRQEINIPPDSLSFVPGISAKKERALNAKFPETKTLDGALNWAESYSGKEFKEAKEALLNYTKVDYNYLKSIPQYLMKVSEFIDHEKFKFNGKVKEDPEKKRLKAENEKLKRELESKEIFLRRKAEK